MEYKPYGYQQIATEYILDHAACGLFLDTGLGKTVCTLTAIEELMYNRFEVARVLIIAPLRVARKTWMEEGAKWDHLKRLTFAKILGPARERIAALEQEADVYLINRENVPWLVQHWGKAWPYDMVVVDELSSFKSARAARFKALRRVLPKIRRIVGLTATPRSNGLMDLWSQVYLLDQGERLGRTLTGYRDRYFAAGRRNGHVVYEWIPKPGAEAAIYRKLKDLCLSMTKEDWLDMPDKVDITAEVELPPKAMAHYRALERDYITRIFESGGQAVVTAANAAVASGKLLQVANGAVYNEEGDYTLLHNEKLEELGSILEAAAGEPVLVYYLYRHDLIRITAYLEDLGYPVRRLDTDEDIDAWNRGEAPVLLAHPASAGHGLNLQAGGHILVWFGVPWSLELYTQACDRLHRQGQRETVRVYHILAKDTLDEEVMRALARKDAGQQALMDALKARREKFLREAV